MTHTQLDDGLQLLVGDASAEACPRVPFNASACSFLATLGAALRADDRAREYADLQSFAFWCRSANIDRLKSNYLTTDLRFGRGLVFHIAPANVPVNAAFTFAFGLLAGNANIIRLPSRRSEQLDIFCDVLGRVFMDSSYAEIRRATAFVRYPHDLERTEALSSRCQARVVWGGDETIHSMRQIALPARAVELNFADCYSLCVMQADAVLASTESELTRLVEGFYNDTYSMDQNACSSPHLVLWLGADVEAAKHRFWQGLAGLVAKRYELAAVHAVEKHARLLEAAITGRPTYFRRYDKQVCVLGAENISNASAELRGRFGLFHEKQIRSLDEIFDGVTTAYQTLTYFGVNQAALRKSMIQRAPLGLDRIVPVGRALDIDVRWDGHDIIQSLSRLVDVR